MKLDTCCSLSLHDDAKVTQCVLQYSEDTQYDDTYFFENDLEVFFLTNVFLKYCLQQTFPLRMHDRVQPKRDPN